MKAGRLKRWCTCLVRRRLWRRARAIRHAMFCRVMREAYVPVLAWHIRQRDPLLQAITEDELMAEYPGTR